MATKTPSINMTAGSIVLEKTGKEHVVHEKTPEHRCAGDRKITSFNLMARCTSWNW
jgi:hypothetical protein